MHAVERDTEKEITTNQMKPSLLFVEITVNINLFITHHWVFRSLEAHRYLLTNTKSKFMTTGSHHRMTLICCKCELTSNESVDYLSYGILCVRHIFAINKSKYHEQQCKIPIAEEFKFLLRTKSSG